MGLGGLTGGGGNVGTGYVKIKPDAQGFGDELERSVGKESDAAASGLGRRASTMFAGAFAAGTAALGKSVFDFANFDAGMREVFTLMPDLSAEATAQMTEDVKRFSSEFGVLPNEVIPSLYNSISAGVPPDNVFEFLETAQQLAKGGATDLATAVDGLSSVVNAYGSDTISATEASDALFTAVRLGKTTVDEMSASLFQVAPIASSFGVSFEEVSATIATLTAQGTPTAVAATQIKGAIAELGKEGTKASDTFAELSGKTFAQFTAEGGTMTEALTLMQAAADENGSSIVDMFGSIEAGQAALGIVKDLDKTNANLEALGSSAGATEAAFETMNEGLAATFSRLRARLAVAFVNIGEAIAPTVEVVGEFVGGLLEAFTMLPGPMQATILGVATIAAGLAAFAGPILKAVQLFKMLGSAMTLLAANPWTLVILALIAATYLIIRNWDTVREFLGEVWEWIKDTAGALADWFVGVWEDVSGAVVAVWDGITGAISAAVDEITAVISTGFEVVATIVETYLEIYRTIFETGWLVIRTTIEAVWTAITTVIETAVSTVTSVISGAWSLVQSITSTAWNGVKTTVETIGGGVVGFVTGIPGKISTAFSTLAGLISAPFTAAFGAIKTAWNSTVGGFGFTAPSWIPGFGGKGFTIPSMATGGVAFAPMVAQIGDAGAGDPEVVSPVSLMRETVVAALAEAGGAAGPTISLVMHVDSEVTDPAFFERQAVEITRVVSRELERQGRAGGRAAVGVGA